MAVLQLREFERIRQGSTFSSGDRQLTSQQFARLEKFSEAFRARTGATLFLNGPGRTLVAQNFVGVVTLGGHQVEVLPKVEGAVSQVRHNLARMVAATLGLPLHADAQTQVGRVDETLLDVMVRMFCAELWTAMRRGLVRNYEAHEENLVVLRGRLNFGEQMRRNLARPDRLHCTFDEFTEDNLLNRVLKAALRVLDRVARSAAASRSVTELLFCFQDVADAPRGSIDWTRLSTNRLSQQYAPLLTMARLFIEGASPDVVSGKGDGFSILFDMNELFEEYIGRTAARVFAQAGLSVHLQGPARYLTCSERGTGAFELRPDIVVGDGARPAFIVDTKWKRLKEDALREAVSSADMYQMLAYGYRYDCPEVILLYPHHAGLKHWVPRRATYTVADAMQGAAVPRISVNVATVDLTELSSVPDQLRRVCLPADGPTAHRLQPAPAESRPLGVRVSADVTLFAC